MQSRKASTVPPLESSAFRSEFAFLAGRTFHSTHTSTERLAALGFLGARLEFARLRRNRWLEVCASFTLELGTTLRVESTLLVMALWIVTVERFGLLLGLHHSPSDFSRTAAGTEVNKFSLL